MSPQNDDHRLTKAERTAQARAKAREIREAQAKKEKRNGLLIRGGVLVAAVAIVVVVALFVIQAQKNNAPVADNGPVPSNANIYGGVTIGKNGDVVAPTTKQTTVSMSSVPSKTPALPAGVGASAAGKPVQIVAYVDFLCPYCDQFEQTYAADMKTWENAGQVTMEYRPFGFLDTHSTTNYSSRAAAAAACVANSSPDKYSAYVTELYSEQPAENSAGLTDAQLISSAKTAGAADITSCVNSGTYRPYIKVVTAQASAFGIDSTPTVYVDGQKWNGTTDFKTYVNGIIAAKKK